MFAREKDPLIPSRFHDNVISDAVPSSNLYNMKLFRPKLGAMIVLSVFVSIILSLSSEKLHQFAPFTGREHEFDYIVVGAGPAGTIVAMNLASKLLKEANEFGGQIGKVLLIESGTRSQSAVEERIRAINKGENGNISAFLNEFDIPLAWSMLSKAPKNQHDRLYFSSHQWVSESINFLGRAVGGSGVHNAMINVRALPTDFDNWNVTKWSHKEVMPYFNKLETFIDNPAPSFMQVKAGDNQNRGKDGPITTSTLGNLISPLAEDFILSSLSAGIPLASLGFNDADPSKRIGVGIYEFNIRGGLRDSVAEAYFRRSIPNNLEIVTGATVQKAIFQKHDDFGEVPTAIGVEYTIDKNRLFRHAMLKQGSNVETEVIFSAGAILTPQLLANSGIEEGGTTKHSPEVGKNVMDHPAIAVSFEMTHDSTEEVLSYFFGDSKLDTFEDLVRSRMKLWVPYIDSPLSTPGFSTGGFLKSPFSTQNGPDIQLTVFPHLEEPHYSLTNKNMSRQWSYMMITVALIQPETRSELILAKSNGTESKISSRPSDTAAASNFQIPVLKPGSLSDNDTSKLVWGIEEVRRIMSSAPVTKRIVKEASPGKLVLGDSLKEYIRNNIMQNSHWSGTCRMGTDEKSVVDEYLKVRGVRNLRVIDASIMPQIPNGNTHSTTCAIALRAVDLIR